MLFSWCGVVVLCYAVLVCAVLFLLVLCYAVLVGVVLWFLVLCCVFGVFFAVAFVVLCSCFSYIGGVVVAVVRILLKLFQCSQSTNYCSQSDQCKNNRTRKGKRRDDVFYMMLLSVYL